MGRFPGRRPPSGPTRSTPRSQTRRAGPPIAPSPCGFLRPSPWPVARRRTASSDNPTRHRRRRAAVRHLIRGPSSRACLPAGIQLNQSNGLFAGTPQLSGTFTFTVQATDPTGSSATRRCSIAITVAADDSDAVTGRRGRRDALPANAHRRRCGTPPYTWSLVSGALPPGLSLNASAGVISGTPTSDRSVPVPPLCDRRQPRGSGSRHHADRSVRPGDHCLPDSRPARWDKAIPRASRPPGDPPRYSWSLSAGAPPAGLTWTIRAPCRHAHGGGHIDLHDQESPTRAGPPPPGSARSRSRPR